MKSILKALIMAGVAGVVTGALLRTLLGRQSSPRMIDSPPRDVPTVNPVANTGEQVVAALEEFEFDEQVAPDAPL